MYTLELQLIIAIISTHSNNNMQGGVLQLPMPLE